MAQRKALGGLNPVLRMPSAPGYGARRSAGGSAAALGGIGFVVTAVACFAVLDAATKVVALAVPALMALWVRYMLQAIVSTAVLLPLHGRGLLRSSQPRLQLLRGLLLSICTGMAFFGLKLMPLGEFTAIVMVTPLTVSVLSVTIFKEKIAPLHWLLIAGGFAGTLFIVRPGTGYLGWAALLPLGCMAGNSAYQLLTSHLGKSENPATTHLYSVWVGAILSSLSLPLSWAVVDSPWIWSLMLFIGILGAAGHFLLVLAYQRASAATLVPYLYTHIGFAVLAGWLVFGHVPDHWAQMGIGLIALCGVGSAWMTARQSRPAMQAPAI